jgi:hypothetical protein
LAGGSLLAQDWPAHYILLRKHGEELTESKGRARSVRIRAVRHAERIQAAAKRRTQILEMLAAGHSRREIAEGFGISQQRLWVILHQLPPAELEAAEATGAGLVRCPHCGLWVALGRAARGRHAASAVVGHAWLSPGVRNACKPTATRCNGPGFAGKGPASQSFS